MISRVFRHPAIPVAGAPYGLLSLFVLTALGCVEAGVPTDFEDLKVTNVEVFGNSQVNVGESITLHTLLKNRKNSTIDGEVTWSSISSTVTVGAHTGVVTGVMEGTATIVATAASGATGEKVIQVNRSPLGSLTITSYPTSMKVYQVGLYEAVVRDASGNVVNSPVTWSSSDPAKASIVANSGVVTAVAVGTVTITATSGVLSAPAQLTITPAAVDHIEVVGTGSIQLGASVDFTVHLYDSHNLELSGRPVQWTSSDQSKATVDQSGRVTGVALGTATITAAAEGKTNGVTTTIIAPLGLQLSGRVIDGVTNVGLSGASIQVLRASDQAAIGSASGGADGTFTTGVFVMPAGGVLLAASRTGYVSGRILVPAMEVTNGTISTEPIPLVPTSGSPGGIAGVVKNARNGQAIPNASLSLFNNVAATAVATTTTNASGVYSFTGIAAGTYRVAATATGFQPNERVGIAVGNNGVTNAQDISLSPSGTGEIRIVLTWGVMPEDIDSHLTGPNGDGTRFHVFFNSEGFLSSAPFAKLDLDDTDSYGPETITITQLNAGGVYRYSVHDFENLLSNTSNKLSLSGAKVQVYASAGLIATFFVPPGPGTLWTVFELTGPIQNPIITRKDLMSFVSNPLNIPSPPALVADDGVLIGWAVGHQKTKRLW